MDGSTRGNAALGLDRSFFADRRLPGAARARCSARISECFASIESVSRPPWCALAIGQLGQLFQAHLQLFRRITATLSTDANVQIVIPMAGSAAVTPSLTLRGLMYIGGIDDKVIGFNAPLIGNVVCPLFSSSSTGAYQASPGPPAVTKRLVGVTGGGHLVMTDLCQKNALGRTAIEEAQADGVCGINSAVIIGLPALFDCGTVDMTTGIKAVDYASTAALEEALMCKDRNAQFASLKANVPSIGDFQEAK
jgi:hypothetical protein